MKKHVSILGFGGSLRKGSYSKALLRAASELPPENATFEIFELDGFPAFNQDLERSMPERVKEFKAKIRAADAIVISTPEYNYSVPGHLKNAIDWASRPYTDNSFDGKPVAIMSSSPGMLGGARAQYHLRQCFVFLNMFPINRPEVILAHADQKFDGQGKLLDEEAKDLIRQLLANLVDLTQKLQSKPTATSSGTGA